jgi:YVTN family beta-propeller protein
VTVIRLELLAIVATFASAVAGQAPGDARAPDIPISHQDRVYAAEQYSNTVSVTDPASNRLLGVIRLGEPTPTNFTPLYRGQLLVHGLGFSPDHRTLAVVSIGSNAISFIDTATNAVKHVTYVGRAPHEAFFTPDGKELWVTVRGEDYVSVVDPSTWRETDRIRVPNGPGMTIFSPDGQYGYVCSSFSPETAAIRVADHAIVGHIAQASPFCPNIAVSPDGTQAWFTLKDSGKAQVFDAHPPFRPLKTLNIGPLANHVNFARNRNGTFAYVTVSGLNEVQVFRTDSFDKAATIPVGKLPHGIWPSGDGTRVYVGLENDDQLIAIDTLTNTDIATIPIGQAPQAVVYVPNAAADGDSAEGLTELAGSGEAAHLILRPVGSRSATGATSIALFDQGLVQVIQAAVTSLSPMSSYILALAERPDGSGNLEPLAAFRTNPAGAAVVTALGQVREVARQNSDIPARFLTILEGTPASPGRAVQVQ